MFSASYTRTMAGAKRVVNDNGICLRRPPAGHYIRLNTFVPPAARDQVQKQPTPLDEMSIPAHARRLISQVAFWHDLTPEDILGPRRFDHIVTARMDAIAAIYLNCRKSSGLYSLPDTGRAMGNRDHTTVLHALRKHGIPTRPYGKKP